jgi:choice-of-anchor C domain-containing protein
MRLIAAGLGLVLLLPVGSAAPAKAVGNLLVNGSFEDGTEDIGPFLSLDKGSESIKGWQVTRGQIDWVGTYFTAADGKRTIDLLGSPGYGGVAQTFKTKKGTKYTVELKLAATPGGGARAIVLEAGDGKKTFDADPKDSTPDNLNWQKVSWEFTATGDQTTLEIYTTEKGDDARGPVIDDVSVREK